MENENHMQEEEEEETLLDVFSEAMIPVLKNAGKIPLMAAFCENGAYHVFGSLLHRGYISPLFEYVWIQLLAHARQYAPTPNEQFVTTLKHIVLPDVSNHYWYKAKGFYQGFRETFCPGATFTAFGGGGTITTIAIELAAFLGFRTINLVGVDLSYSIPETVLQTGGDQFGDGVGLYLESTEDDDSNHFDPRYFGKGKKWHNPNVRDMRIGIARAANYAATHGILVQNATVGGTLDQIPRISLEELVR